LRKSLERPFLYRGVSTLELRSLAINEDGVDIAFYARPIFPDDHRIKNRTREAAFAEQLFQDAVTVLETAWRNAGGIAAITLTVWVKAIGASDHEVPVLTTRVTRERASGIFAGRRWRALRSRPLDVLRQFPTRVRVDRHGNFHEERTL
jgi:hypothetical protein